MEQMPLGPLLLLLLLQPTYLARPDGSPLSGLPETNYSFA
jgi:hypothetical protein